MEIQATEMSSAAQSFSTKLMRGTAAH